RLLLAFLIPQAQRTADEDPLAVALWTKQPVLPFEAGRGLGWPGSEHRRAKEHGQGPDRYRQKGKAHGKSPGMRIDPTWLASILRPWVSPCRTSAPFATRWEHRTSSSGPRPAAKRAGKQDVVGRPA